MSLELAAQTIINGLFIGFLFGLAGMGLTLIFGIMRILNIATGALIMFGAYITYWLFCLLSFNPLLAIGVSALFGFAFGVVLYFSLVNRLIRTPGLISLLALYGVAIILENAMLYVWTPNPRCIPFIYPSLNFGLVTISGNKMIVSLFAIGASFLLLAFLKWTYIGRAIRATVQDWTAASLMGVNVRKVYAIGFAIGISLTTFAGGLVAMTYTFEPLGGLQYTLYAFCVVVLGTLGNPAGCLLAGVIIGMATSITGSYWTVNMSPAVAYFILIMVFLLKPSGLMGKKE
ncbi:MAG: branched-chain amino acid ABC transporter permease [Candidatus Bathyarchaeota archaeon]|nr:branched-chain amino acid ABC transporter permease [Candidatus Bathyarchaeota archaeon]